MATLMSWMGLLYLGAGPPANTPRPTVHAILEATAAVFASPGDIDLRVTVENSGASCFPIYIDPSIQPGSTADRPGTVLRLDISDENGTRVGPSNRIDADVRGLRTSDLLVLNCGSYYGRHVWPAKADWGYKLGPGRYRARVQLQSRVGTFVRGRPALLKELVESIRLGPKTVGHMLQDWSSESDEVRFEVGRE
jgi:hypothetical protein